MLKLSLSLIGACSSGRQALRVVSARAFSSSPVFRSEKKRGQFVSAETGATSAPKVKLYPGFQTSQEEKRLDEADKPANEVYAKKIIEDFYGLNQLEYEKQEEEDIEIDEDLARKQQKEFNIDEAIRILKDENVQDICCINIPKEANYADYLVIGSCLSDRHLNSAFVSFYRSYKTYQDASKGLQRSSSKETKWCAMDLGKIVVHLFLPEYREYYDLESLWTCGAEFDDKLSDFAKQREDLEKKFLYAEVDEDDDFDLQSPEKKP